MRRAVLRLTAMPCAGALAALALAACDATGPATAPTAGQEARAPLDAVIRANAEVQDAIRQAEAQGAPPPRLDDPRVHLALSPIGSVGLLDGSEFAPGCGASITTILGYIGFGGDPTKEMANLVTYQAEIMQGLASALDCAGQMGPRAESFIATEPTSLGYAQVIPTADMVRGGGRFILSAMLATLVEPDVDAARKRDVLDAAVEAAPGIALTMTQAERRAASAELATVKVSVDPAMAASLDQIVAAIQAARCGVLCREGTDRS